jgi:coenzyme F420-reducing hydrogenase beta subunit
MEDIIKKRPEILETLTVIPELLEKYEIKESNQERFKKIKAKKMTHGSVLAFIIGANARDNFSLDKITKMIKEKIDIPEAKAKLLAKEIKSLTGGEKKTKAKEDTVTKEDPYREKT